MRAGFQYLFHMLLFEAECAEEDISRPRIDGSHLLWGRHIGFWADAFRGQCSYFVAVANDGFCDKAERFDAHGKHTFVHLVVVDARCKQATAAKQQQRLSIASLAHLSDVAMCKFCFIHYHYFSVYMFVNGAEMEKSFHCSQPEGYENLIADIFADTDGQHRERQIDAKIAEGHCHNAA